MNMILSLKHKLPVSVLINVNVKSSAWCLEKPAEMPELYVNILKCLPFYQQYRRDENVHVLSAPTIVTDVDDG